jgi:hypothetical protein
VRGYGWENWVNILSADLSYAARRLIGNPGFTAVSIFTVALAIGALHGNFFGRGRRFPATRFLIRIGSRFSA